MIIHDNRQEDIEIGAQIIEKIEIAIDTVLSYFELENLSLEISISYVTPSEIQELNAGYRKKNMVTDVLSFPMYEEVTELEVESLLGDIVICPICAQEQSLEYEHSFEREMVYLTIHSMLHLLGYDHMEEEEKTEMRTVEKEILQKIAIFKS